MGARKHRAAGSPQTSPRIWLLLGYKAGDNNQVLALAEALGLPYTEKRLEYRASEILSNLMLGPNLLGLAGGTARQLAPPWPDLVITAGRRSEPVAHWIRRRSGGRTRLVHIGRPWSRPERFDLVITTPQYQVPDAPNVICRELPLHRVNHERMAAAIHHWRLRLLTLPPPRIGVLIGGDSGPFHLDVAKARRLAHAVARLASKNAGSLLVTTSARTPAAAARAFEAAVDAPCFMHHFMAGEAENPYLAILGLADAFVVTGDSMSMLTEACVSGRPVHIFDMGDRSTVAPSSSFARRLLNCLRYKALTFHLGQLIAPRRMRRDVSRLHTALIADGRAVWLGEEFPSRPPPTLAGCERETARLRALLATTGSD